MGIVKEIKPEIRYLKELKEVLYDQSWFQKAEKGLELYYIYRGLNFINGIRYDITVIPPVMLGQEFNRTFGHFHKGNFGEIYKVIEGKGIFFLQKNKIVAKNKISPKEVKEIRIIEAEKDDIIVIPPGFGHITINNSLKETLIIANWISKNCQSDYSVFKKTKGPAFFYTKKGWVKNKNYPEVPEIISKQAFKKLPKNWRAVLEK